MKIIYLLPPSEGKNSGGDIGTERLSFNFKKPLDIAINATEKDLKCKDKRYQEGIGLNISLLNSLSLEEREAAVSSSPGGEELRGGFMLTIERYSGVMYNAIDYSGMSSGGQKYFEDNFIILSGMYGLLTPLDTIGNYKLPIETKGLYQFWGDQISQSLDNLEADYIVDMLPGSYAKMIHWKTLKTPYVRINFLHHKDGELKKMTHGVKKVKGEYINDLCEKQIRSIDDFIGEKVQISEKEYHINVISN